MQKYFICYAHLTGVQELCDNTSPNLLNKFHLSMTKSTVRNAENDGFDIDSLLIIVIQKKALVPCM